MPPNERPRAQISDYELRRLGAQLATWGDIWQGDSPAWPRRPFTWHPTRYICPHGYHYRAPASWGSFTVDCIRTDHEHIVQLTGYSGQRLQHATHATDRKGD